MIAIASVSTFGEVTLGLHGKPLKPPEIVGVINGLRMKVEEEKTRVIVLEDRYSQLQREVSRLHDQLHDAKKAARLVPAIPETQTENDGGSDGQYEGGQGCRCVWIEVPL